MLRHSRCSWFYFENTTGSASPHSYRLVCRWCWRCSTPHHSHQNCCCWGPATLSLSLFFSPPPPPPPPPISYFWWGGVAVKSQWCHFRMWESGKVSWFCGEWCSPPRPALPVQRRGAAKDDHRHRHQFKLRRAPSLSSTSCCCCRRRRCSHLGLWGLDLPWSRNKPSPPPCQRTTHQKSCISRAGNFDHVPQRWTGWPLRKGASTACPGRTGRCRQWLYCGLLCGGSPRLTRSRAGLMRLCWRRSGRRCSPAPIWG